MSNVPRYRQLSERQQRFVLEYAECGNATESARRAGYSRKCAGVIGPRLTKNPVIAEAIRRLGDRRTEKGVASLRERQEFWTKVLRGDIAGMRSVDRLKASELLSRSKGELVDRRESMIAVTAPMPDWNAFTRGTAVRVHATSRLAEKPAIDVQAVDESNRSASANVSQPATPTEVEPEQGDAAPKTPHLRLATLDPSIEQAREAERRTEAFEESCRRLGLTR